MQEQLPTVDRCLQLSLGGVEGVWINRDGNPAHPLGAWPPLHGVVAPVFPSHCQTECGRVAVSPAILSGHRQPEPEGSFVKHTNAPRPRCDVAAAKGQPDSVPAPGRAQGTDHDTDSGLLEDPAMSVSPVNLPLGMVFRPSRGPMPVGWHCVAEPVKL